LTQPVNIEEFRKYVVALSMGANMGGGEYNVGGNILKFYA